MGFLALNAQINLFAVHRYFFRRIDADPYLIALYAQNSDGHFVTNHQSLANAARQNQHCKSPINLLGPTLCHSTGFGIVFAAGPQAEWPRIMGPAF